MSNELSRLPSPEEEPKAEKNWFLRHPVVSSVLAASAITAVILAAQPTPEDPVEVQRREDAKAEMDACRAIYLSPSQMSSADSPAVVPGGARLREDEVIEVMRLCHEVVAAKFPTKTVPES